MHKIDHTLEVAFAADGNLDRHGRAAECLIDAGDRLHEIRSFAIHLIDDQQSRDPKLIRVAPCLFGLDFYAVDCVDQH